MIRNVCERTLALPAWQKATVLAALAVSLVLALVLLRWFTRSADRQMI